MHNDRPIFLFAFANDRGGSLRLGDEQNAVWEELKALHQSGRIEIQNMGFATLESIYARFNDYHDRIALFHYGGHSDQNALLFSGIKGRAENLATLLGQEHNLKLVFLNGCSNYEQVHILHEKGVPAVIATEAGFEDKRALIM